MLQLLRRPAPRISQAARGNLLIASIPLFLAGLIRALDALEHHIHDRLLELARIESAIAELAAMPITDLPKKTDGKAPAPEQPASSSRSTLACAFCNDGTPATRHTEHDTPICDAEHTADPDTAWDLAEARRLDAESLDGEKVDAEKS